MAATPLWVGGNSDSRRLGMAIGCRRSVKEGAGESLAMGTGRREFRFPTFKNGNQQSGVSKNSYQCVPVGGNSDSRRLRMAISSRVSGVGKNSYQCVPVGGNSDSRRLTSPVGASSSSRSCVPP